MRSKRVAGRRAVTWLTALVLLSAAPGAGAVLITYSDRAAWIAAVDTRATLRSDGFDTAIGNADLIVFPSGVTAVGVNPLEDARNQVTGGRYAATVNSDGTNGYSSISWNFPFPVLGFAADWFTTNTQDGAIVVIAGTTIVFGGRLGNPGDGFLGFLSDRPFTSARFTTDGGTGNEYFEADDLSFTYLIAEPSTMLLTSLAGILVTAQRRTSGRISPTA